ncbi:MAG: TetR/AcrR family transcriptional regulator [Bacteroidia bacterium]|nr:TetR/AcrR family transcriptional regulator [Bacteroidia bacterium]
MMKNALIQQYITYTLEQNKTPESVYLFAKSAGTNEQEFYNYFSSLQALEMDIYKTWFDDVMEKCKTSEPWNDYAVREKVLAVFYTFIESLKTNRSFVKYLKQRDYKLLAKWPAYLNGLHQSFVAELKPILADGVNSQELAERKYIDAKYVDALWLNFLFVIKFWIDDDSPGFEKSDAAIEKSVNLALDLMGKSPLDAAFDFGKFLFQSKS